MKVKQKKLYFYWQHCRENSSNFEIDLSQKRWVVEYSNLVKICFRGFGIFRSYFYGRMRRPLYHVVEGARKLKMTKMLKT